MSTYHVAFAVLKYGFLEAKSDKGVLFKSWYKKDELKLLEYINDIGPRILDFYDEIFDVHYPMDSIDLMVIPEYQKGAMENFGHVMFQARAMLFDEILLNEEEKNAIPKAVFAAASSHVVWKYGNHEMVE